MATTSILPLTLGQAVLGRATEPDAPPPEYLRIDGECWKLVTDPAAIEAAQAALEARERADSAFAMAQYAPRIANRPPALGDAEGKAPGAGWLEYDPATQLLKQMWRWTGQAWEELPMDPVMIPVIQIGTGTAGDLTADRLIVTSEFVARVAQILELSVENLVVTEGATINELVALAIAGATAEFQQAYIQNLRTNGAVIDEAVIGDLAANIITSGLFRTAEFGQRWEIDSNGIVMYGVDANEVESEMVRLGPAGENLLTIGDTTVSPTGVQSSSGAFDSLAVGGDDLSTVLDRLPLGVVAWGQIRSSSAYDSSLNLVRRAELQTRLRTGRIYRVSISSRYLQSNATVNTWGIDAIHYSYGDPIFPNNPGSGVYQGVSGRHLLSAGSQLVPPLEFIINTDGHADNRAFWAMYSTQATHAAAGIRLYAGNNFPTTMMVEDLGPSQESILKRWNDNNEGGAQDPGTTEQRYVRTYTSNGTETWNDDGTLRSSSGDVTQGLYGGGPTRFRRRGGWKFPSFTSDLSGATVEKVEMYIHMNGSWSSAGATVNLATHNGNIGTSLSAFTSIYGWKPNSGRWVTLPSSLHAGFKNGTHRGIGVIPTSSSTAQYAIFAGSGAKVRITFRK